MNFQNLIINIILYIFYAITLTLLTLILQINSKRLKKIYKIDITIQFMIIYVLNFIICYYLFEEIQIFIRISISIVLIFVSIYIGSKINIIGLTGGIACGKSWACEYFQHNLGIEIIDCDKLSRRIYIKQQPAYQKLLKYFGDQILDENKEIDRKKLGKLFFKIKRPQIFNKIGRILYNVRNSKRNIYIMYQIKRTNNIIRRSFII
ncbi:hypothetical protein IMG5_006200 [Ichthyophthirius multifiliis]|uniref:Dephospho-CoA kinase n=1 Tax=Ichthyophthirius multifiliis TaxID=5932 RepID=G0QJL1_ICHMU|nr:hypothetical protein IMG5_006200 [Ichthyophthirius multifiliis]EGR34592.1 hypothetical protein IMG5_006200 [Ichthyophthirius multifiliis]|eukprot:XP_004039896.1 hypothetical protein IMG5_006200 [Ichthyophthirius multifiliis]